MATPKAEVIDESRYIARESVCGSPVSAARRHPNCGLVVTQSSRGVFRDDISGAKALYIIVYKGVFNIVPGGKAVKSHRHFFCTDREGVQRGPTPGKAGPSTDPENVGLRGNDFR